MREEHVGDLAQSVRRELRRRAIENHEEVETVLLRYALERFLYRLAQSQYRDEFVLKGAMLFYLWLGTAHRPTRDVDLLGHGDISAERLERIFREVCDEAVSPDGVAFLADTVRGESIREGQDYEGVRITLQARLGGARLKIQLDIGFGDAVTPAPEKTPFPALLRFPEPVLLTYPVETVVSEKFQAMVALGITNSRMKDFYDLWILSRTRPFTGSSLSRAISATFGRRRTDLPVSAPVALTGAFAGDPAKQAQWHAFLRRGRLDTDPPELGSVVGLLHDFLMPPVLALHAGDPFARHWPPGGPWQIGFAAGPSVGENEANQAAPGLPTD